MNPEMERIKLMLDQLYHEVQYGRVIIDRDAKFITDLYENKKYKLSPKQLNWLEMLYERY